MAWLAVWQGAAGQGLAWHGKGGLRNQAVFHFSFFGIGNIVSAAWQKGGI
jgi:hypothetical protein